MRLVSKKLFGNAAGYWHFCPACERLHPLPEGWEFDGDVDSPTFTPSFRHSWGKEGGPCCHYILTSGILNFCGDCTHDMAGLAVPLPDLPQHSIDAWIE